MRNTLAFALVASLGLFACGGAATPEAKSSENPTDWSTFSGKYSDKAEPRAAKADAPAKKEAAPKAEDEDKPTKAKEAPKETEEETPLFTLHKLDKPASKGTVKGESVSTVSLDSLSAAVAKSKVQSTGSVVGKQYETITVETKKATIKITRPAATPNPKGPDVVSPTNKLGDIGKNESAWYDDQGDVIVVVSAAKKATAAKILNAVVKH
jgi:hypothetical protein